jgi:hypothetical protein
MKLAVEPGHQPAHLGALFSACTPQRSCVACTGLVQVSACGLHAGAHGAVFIDHHRQGGGRVELDEIGARLPRAFFQQFGVDAHFGQRHADAARKGIKRKMQQTNHVDLPTYLLWACCLVGNQRFAHTRHLCQ